MPHLIITYGPAGSGKGFIRKKYTAVINSMYPQMDAIEYENTFVAEIDHHVENDGEYQNAVFVAICNFFDECNPGVMRTPVSFSKHLRELLSDFETNEPCSASRLSDRLTMIYQRFRTKYNSTLDCEIQDAVKKKQHIIFETTGQNRNPLDWLWQCPGNTQDSEWTGPFCNVVGYVKTVVYPYVEPEMILSQATLRFIERVVSWYACLKECKTHLSQKSFNGFQSCLRNQQTVGVPRLPDLKELAELIPLAQDNIVPYIENRFVDNIILFDNNRTESEPLYFNMKTKSQNTKRIIKFLSKCKNMSPLLKNTLLHMFVIP